MGFENNMTMTYGVLPAEETVTPARPLRVLHLLNDLCGVGNGIVNAAVDIASEQSRLGHIVAMCSAGGDYEPLLARQGVRHFALEQRRPSGVFGALSHLSRIVGEFRPDVVHCHNVTGLLLARTIRLTSRFRLVAHVHNVHQRSSQAMGLADCVIAVSNAVATAMSQAGIPVRKIRVVLNGTLGSPRAARAADSRKKELHQPAILTVAGLNHRKGIAELISAFELLAKENPEAHLYIVGTGPERELFEARGASSPFARRIHFEGFQQDPFPYMLSARVFVLASLRDSFGLVLTEARECGCAIIASDVDGIPEALGQGRSGKLVPPGDVKALHVAMKSLLEDPIELERLRLAARVGLEQFTVRRMASDVISVYSDLLGDRSVQSARTDDNPSERNHHYV